MKEGSIKVNGAAITGDRFTMPAENVTVTAEFERFAFLVTVVKPAHGTILAPHQSVPAGSPVALDVRPDLGYRLKAGSLKVNGVAIAGTTFTMPAREVTVTAEFEQYLFWITILPMNHGTLVAPTGPLEPGTQVILTVMPSEGYQLASGSIKLNGTRITGTSFLMPDYNVSISAEFELVLNAFGGEI